MKINAEDILRFVERDGWHDHYDLGVSEFCPYHENRRIDMFYFSRWNRQTKGYEIKVNRNDFLQDKKWQEYLKFCTWFSFVAPEGVIKKEELPDKIGLVEIKVVPVEKDHYTMRNVVEEDGDFYKLEKVVVKRPQRLRETIEDQDYIRLLEGLLAKMIYKRNLLTS